MCVEFCLGLSLILLLSLLAKATNSILLLKKHFAHIHNMIDWHEAQFGRYRSPSNMVTKVRAKTPPPS